MDSKRKINGANTTVGEQMDDRATKRRRIPSDPSDLSQGESPETTSYYGRQLLEAVKQIEKSGRLVANDFLTLPSKRHLPDYYQFTKVPIAIDMIEAKLVRHEFPTLSNLESYFKRMVQNAKDYNETGSQIVNDAERLGREMTTFMKKHNPAYKTPGYVARPTPNPGEESDGDSDEEEEDDESESDVEVELQPRRRGRPPKYPQALPQRSSSTPALSESQYTGVSFSGLTFQQGQEKLVTDMINHKDDPEDLVGSFEVFVYLPSRSLRDYYQIITHPVSLKGILKQVKGVHGRNEPTGVSDFKTWAALEDEVSYLWRNAWQYNEDGSEISLQAKSLRTFFYKALKEAKQAIPEPVGPKIKLKMSEPAPAPRITLKLPGSKVSPADSPAPETNELNGNAVATNGTARRNPFGGSYSSATPVPTLDQLDRARSMSGSVPSPTPSSAALVKNEDGARNSPSVLAGFSNNYRASSQAVSTPGLPGSGMLPPSTPGFSNQNYGGYAQSFNHSQQQTSNPAYESGYRPPGKDASDATITNLRLETHPGLNISRHFQTDILPDPKLAQQSITIHLPATHYYLQIKPTLSASVVQRQYKLFVTSGTNRLHGMPRIPGFPVDARDPLFEARLLPGVTRIEVEIIAALPKGATKPANGLDYEIEKITVFANLMK